MCNISGGKAFHPGGGGPCPGHVAEGRDGGIPGQVAGVDCIGNAYIGCSSSLGNLFGKDCDEESAGRFRVWGTGGRYDFVFFISLIGKRRLGSILSELERHP